MWILGYTKRMLFHFNAQSCDRLSCRPMADYEMYHAVFFQYCWNSIAVEAILQDNNSTTGRNRNKIRFKPKGSEDHNACCPTL